MNKNQNLPICASSELDIFAKPPVQTSILSSKWVEYIPSVNYEKGKSPITIEIPATKGEYVDLSNIFLYLEVSIVNSNNQIINSNDEIGPINYLLNTLFKKCEIFLNNKKVSMDLDYPYRAYLEALLNFGIESKTTHLDSGLWSKDTCALMDSIDFTQTTSNSEQASVQPSSTPINKMETTKRSIEYLDQSNKRLKRSTGKVNLGLLERMKSFHDKSCELYGRLHGDVFNIEKHLIDDVNITIKLTKNDDKFCLIGKSGFSLLIDDVSINVRKVKISDEVLVAHALALERANAFYPLSRVDVQGRTINAGVTSEQFENVIKGTLPKRIILGMVESDAYNGSFSKNPFNFQNFNIESLTVSINGDTIPYNTFYFDYKSKRPRYLKGYYTLFTSNELAMRSGNDISIGEYPNGYNLIALDLSQDGCINTDHFNLENTGSLRISFKFSEATTKAITVIQYFEFESYFEITKLRNIDYQFVN